MGKKQTKQDQFLDTVQTALDVAGFIPGVGSACDLANAGISFARGNVGEGCISLVAMIPGIGDAAAPMLKVLNKIPSSAFKNFATLLATFLEILKTCNVTKILDGARGLLDELLEMIEKYAPAVGRQLRKLFCEKLKWACFVAGTVVLTPIGVMAIENVQAGDLILSKDPVTGTSQAQRVERVFSRETFITYQISFGDETIETTDEHPFYVYGKGFVEARLLEQGDEIACNQSDLEELRLKSVKNIEKHLHTELVRVYNLTVSNYHTYFVGETGVWVHNGKCDVPGNSKLKSAARMTAKQQKEAAEKLGFKKTNYFSSGERVYKKGNNYISYDRDAHNGGVWKMADSVKNLGDRRTRLGTFDAKLNKIGE